MTKSVLRRLLLSLLLCLCAACHSDNDDASNANGTADLCSTARQNKFVYNLMKDTYLWYQYVPEVDPTAYQSPQALMEALRYAPLDKWSYVASKTEADNFYLHGKYLGLGFGVKFDEAGACRLKFVYADSPADRVGLKRGDTLLSVNGVSMAAIQQEGRWETIFGPEAPGVKVSLAIRQATGDEIPLELEKDWVLIQPVLHQRVIVSGDRRIAYLAYTSFLNFSQETLAEAFADFKQQQARELILDLRYNSGGTGLAAQYLASLIAGGKVRRTDLFTTFIHNDKYRWRDENIYFLELNQALTLDRLVVITTNETCSASELIISCLEPYLPVIVIGDTTCGKPLGMYQHDYCDMQVAPIEFRIANARGLGGYFDGIPAACYAQDDLTQALGAENEDSLQTALRYLTEGNCAANDLTRTKTSSPALPINTQGLRREINAF